MESNLEFIKLVNQVILSKDRYQTGVHAESEEILADKPIVVIVAEKCIRLAMRITIRYRKLLRTSGTRPFPAVCVLSLSEEQILQGKTQEDFVSFFREPRFENPTGDILIETKSLRLSLIKSNLFKPSIPIYFFQNNLSEVQRSEVLRLFDEAVQRWRKISNPDRRENLKALYFIFELAVWFTVRAEKITLITTQSTMHRLPSAFEILNSSFNRKMFWYSTNSQPIKKKGLPLEKPNFSQNLSREIDMHYVWDLDSKLFLNSYGISRVKSVGSILFVKPETVSQGRSDFNLAYFDVTPFEHTENYYTTERMCANLSKLVEITSDLSASTNLKIDLLVKPKRKIKKSHSQEYANMLRNYEKEGKLKIINPAVNLYGLVNEVNCIIGIPFTSPVVVGRELNVPSAYFDTYVDDYQLPRTHNGFQVISDEVQLATWLEKFMQRPSTS